MKRRILDNDTFVKENFENLVKKYPRQRIVISCGRIFTGKDAVKKARERYPGAVPLSLPVPGPEEFAHIL